MTLSKILQFIYNQAEVKDQKLQPLKDFISKHHHAPVDLTIQVLKMAEASVSPTKLLKSMGSSRDGKKAAKGKVEQVFLGSPKELEEILLRFMSGREEQSFV